MQNYTPSIFTNGFANGAVSAAKPDPFKRKYVTTCYQGDVAFLTPFRDTATYAATAKLPTGSICHLDADGKAVAGVGEVTDLTNCPVPYLVYVGNDQMSVKSQKGNSVGGIVSLIPCTGYYRFVTTIYDTTKTFKAGDFLTAAVTQAVPDGTDNRAVKAVCDADYPDGGVGVITKVTTGVYTDLVLGIADCAVAKDHFDLPSLRFTCYFIPPTQATGSSN